MNGFLTADQIGNALAASLAFVVSLLTLSNAARLRSGVLAVSTYLFGGGMLSLSAAFFLMVIPEIITNEGVWLMHIIFFTVGFLLLGLGSFKIYQMSRIK